MTVGSQISVSSFTTSTEASGTTTFFMHDMLKPYTSSQNAMWSWCFCGSPTSARLMLQRSGQTVGAKGVKDISQHAYINTKRSLLQFIVYKSNTHISMTTFSASPGRPYIAHVTVILYSLEFLSFFWYQKEPETRQISGSNKRESKRERKITAGGTPLTCYSSTSGASNSRQCCQRCQPACSQRKDLGNQPVPNNYFSAPDCSYFALRLHV